MIRISRTLGLAALLLCAAAPARAQKTAPEIVRAAAARMQPQAQSINDYTLVVKTVGQAITFHSARTGPGGPFTLSLGAEGQLAQGFGMLSASGEMLLLTVAQGGAEIDSLVSYGGVVPLAGGAAHRVDVNMAEAGRAGPEGGPSRFTVMYDTATLLPARMEMAGLVGNAGELAVTIDYSDWRRVEGMMVPFHRRLVAHGFRAVAFPDTAELGRIVQTGSARIKALPAADRALLEQMLPILDALLKKDELVLDGYVSSARVNAGRPAGVTLVPVGGG